MTATTAKNLITIKRASEYARALGEAANAISLDTGNALSIHTDTANAVNVVPDSGVIGLEGLTAYIETGRAKMAESVNRTIALIRAQYRIRNAIADTNFRNGVDEILTERAGIDAVIAKLTAFITVADHSNEAADANALGREIVANRERAKSAERIYGRQDTVTVGFTTEEFVADLKKKLAAEKRKRSDLQDRLAAANVVTKIDLDNETMTLLKELGIVE